MFWLLYFVVRLFSWCVVLLIVLVLVNVFGGRNGMMSVLMLSVL